jgi:dipeptidyl aminopeptidase/acylaminoacyl peptidase
MSIRQGRFPSVAARLVAVAALVCLALTTRAADTERVTHANYKQAFHFSSAFLRQFIYDTQVTPNWIGKTDSFWYAYRTSKGKTWWRVDPHQATKVPLFDHAKVATFLSEAVQKPLDAAQLPLTRVSINDEGTKIKFVVDDTQFDYDLAAEKLTKLGKAPPAPVAAFGGRGGRGFQQRQDEQQQQQQQNQQRGGRGQQAGGPRRGLDYRVFSPDRKAYVFVRNHNLYLLETGENPLAALVLPIWSTTLPGVLGQAWAMTAGATMLRENKATQLTTDGAEDYSFGRMAQFGTGMDDDVSPPTVNWSADSKSFYATRVDSRGVQDLYLVNALTLPRPTLEKYKYPMPGEEAVRKSELFVCDRASKKMIHIKPKWKDENYGDLRWGKSSDELRFVRRDRLWRHAELCSTSIKTGESKCLILEGFENAPLTTQPIYTIEETDEMIWWSERSGWGHFYLYDRNGKLKNAITSGLFRAERIVSVDPKNRVLYFRGNGREPNENVYYQHLYSVHLGGTGLTLMDPGDANHSGGGGGGGRGQAGPPGPAAPSNLSPSRQYLVDNCDRVDMAPVSVLRDATGKEIMKLENADLSRLYEVGWKMPERFTVKAADGVTDLFGDMWKPFDFNPKKKYPIIVHCYPGPQTEGVTHTFSADNGNQQMAQLGFIVIQVGHRGGAPTRSKAYASYGYFNLRDYGLEDKKAAVEQLAARCPFIDIDRVGIYGHSGGGFMSAAALLQKPYNEFFKAAVASAGNHDNNIYNNGWAERYHGMKEVAVNKDADAAKNGQATAGSSSGTGGGTDRTRARRTRGGAEDDAEDVEGVSGKQTTGQKAQGGAEEMRFDIKVPTNTELAANLKGALLLVHGDMDNNVHPANTMRLVDALIKANKRFDMLILPGKRHGFADAQPYFTQRMWDFFADHLIGDRQAGADILEKQENGH